MKSRSIYFISGVSGVGKTAIIPYLKTLVPTHFEVHDFDEGGVPAGADHTWRINKTREWLSAGNHKSENGVTLVVCGFSNPDEISLMEKDFPGLQITTILLDGDAQVIEQRLRGRNTDSAVKADLERVVGSAENFIQNNTRFIPVLRDICKKHNCALVDTTNSDPKVVAEVVAKLIE